MYDHQDRGVHKFCWHSVQCGKVRVTLHHIQIWQESGPPNGVRSDWHTHPCDAVGGSPGGALEPRPIGLFRWTRDRVQGAH